MGRGGRGERVSANPRVIHRRAPFFTDASRELSAILSFLLSSRSRATKRILPALLSRARVTEREREREREREILGEARGPEVP